MMDQVKAAWDAVVARVAPPEPAAAPAPVTEPRNADGTFAPKEPPKEPVAPEAQAAEAVAETTAAKPPSAKAVKEMSQALTALRRARVPQSKIDALSQSEILEWGSSLKADQAVEDRRRREPKEPSTDPEQSGSPENEADPEADSEETQGFEQLASLHRDTLALHARTEMSGDFPALKDATTWKRVREHALQAWMETDAYDHFDDHAEGAAALVRDACIALGVQRATAKVTSPVRDASQPTGSRPGDRYAAYKGLSPHDLTMRLLGERMPPLEVRRIVEEVHARS